MIRRGILGKLWTIAILAVASASLISGAFFATLARADCGCGKTTTASLTLRPGQNVKVTDAYLRCQDGHYFLKLVGIKRMGTEIDLADLTNPTACKCAHQRSIQLLSRVNKCDGRLSSDFVDFYQTFELECSATESIKRVELLQVTVPRMVELDDCCKAHSAK